MKYMQSIEKRLIKIEEHFVITALALLAGLQILQVFFRYFLNRPLAWVDETSRYLFVWMVMVGAGLAMGKAAHFSIEFIKNIMPEPLQIISAVIVDLVTIAFTVGVIWYGMLLLKAASTQVTPTLQMPFWVPYSAIPAAGALIIIHVLFRIINDLSRK